MSRLLSNCKHLVVSVSCCMQAREVVLRLFLVVFHIIAITSCATTGALLQDPADSDLTQVTMFPLCACYTFSRELILLQLHCTLCHHKVAMPFVLLGIQAAI